MKICLGTYCLYYVVASIMIHYIYELSSCVIVIIIAVHVTKHAYDSSKQIEMPPKCYFFNSVVTITLVVVYDTIKFVKKNLAWKIKFVSLIYFGYAFEISLT